ncbi:MAG: hypothetical protein M1833_004392 [Piccolia ochrophora]|nr:MAG: hypothetical protein M1833_004392 [Piccolia ochrophora]
MASTSRVIPSLQAGGGNPSESSSHKTVQHLSPKVLKHLKTIFHKLGKSKDHLDKGDITDFFGHLQGAEPSSVGQIDVWDGEQRSPSDVESTSLEPEPKQRRGLRLPGSRSPRRKLSDAKAEKETIHVKAEEPGTPTPSVSPTTTMRAEPRVLHGYTLTKDVSFRDVCAAIKDAAFVTSNLPVIVSLEVHASIEQQKTMVEIMKESWKDMLVDDSTYVEGKGLPSPENLRHKLLVKVKRAAPSKPDETTPDTPLVVPDRVRSNSSTSSSEDRGGSSKGAKKKKNKVAEALGNLGIYTRSYHFSHFSQPEASIPTHVFSLSEKAVMDAHENHGEALFAHNLNYFMRAYPSGLRVSSSNLDPSMFWRKGIQMVALNWQRWDQGMMLNEGMFAGEGGWVLKPEGYRGNDDSQSGGQAKAIAHKTLNLTIEIFAAQDIPLPVGDQKSDGFRPYIKCELHVEKPEERTGEPIEGGGKTKDGEYKRKTATRKGVDPDFKGETMKFTGIPGVVEELSFLRFKIQDDEIGKDDLAAWACIRLDRLQKGYRFVHLLDARGAESRGVVLVRISKEMR